MMIPNPTRSMKTVTNRTGSTRAHRSTAHACRTPEAGWDHGQDRDPARVQAVRLSHGEVVRQMWRLRRVRLGGGAVASRGWTRALAGVADQRGAALSRAPGEDGHRRIGP